MQRLPERKLQEKRSMPSMQLPQVWRPRPFNLQLQQDGGVGWRLVLQRRKLRSSQLRQPPKLL